MKRKPKKFLSGGEVAALAGLGYLGYQAYKDYQAGKKPEEDKGGFRPLTREQTDKITPRRESAAAPSEDREKRGEGKFPQEAGYGTSGGFDSKEAAPAPAPAPALRKVNKAKPVVKDRSVTSAAGPNKDGTTPYISDDSKTQPATTGDQKALEREVFLSKKAGLSGRGITTPGKSKDKKGSTAKGRSENPIQGTIDNAGKSMARTPQQKMSERAREVQRRRDEEAKSRYKKGGSVKTAKPTMRSASSRADGIAIRGKTRA